MSSSSDVESFSRQCTTQEKMILLSIECGPLTAVCIARIQECGVSVFLLGVVVSSGVIFDSDEESR